MMNVMNDEYNYKISFDGSEISVTFTKVRKNELYTLTIRINNIRTQIN